MTYAIELNVPLPTSPVSRVNAKYPFGTMPLGASFLVSATEISRAMNAARSFRDYHPDWGFACAREGDSLRIWRTA